MSATQLYQKGINGPSVRDRIKTLQNVSSNNEDHSVEPEKSLVQDYIQRFSASKSSNGKKNESIAQIRKQIESIGNLLGNSTNKTSEELQALKEKLVKSREHISSIKPETEVEHRDKKKILEEISQFLIRIGEQNGSGAVQKNVPVLHQIEEIDEAEEK